MEAEAEVEAEAEAEVSAAHICKTTEHIGIKLGGPAENHKLINLDSVAK